MDTTLILRGRGARYSDHDWQNEGGSHYQMTPIISFVRPLDLITYSIWLDLIAIARRFVEHNTLNDF